MAINSVFRVTFSIQNSNGRVIAGPYTANIGVSGGSRGDVHTGTLAASLATAVSANLLAILQAQGFSGSAAPGGTVVIETYSHGSSPDVFI